MPHARRPGRLINSHGVVESVAHALGTRQVYEAAELDRAGPWSRFRYVTWPLLTPITFFILVTSSIGNLQGALDQVYLMTKGGPGYATYLCLIRPFQRVCYHLSTLAASC